MCKENTTDSFCEISEIYKHFFNFVLNFKHMTIAKAVEDLISQSPFLDEALSENLINISSLARKIRPDIEAATMKKVQESAIIMAISRRPPGQNLRISKSIRAFMSELGDIIVRSGLSDHTFENSPTLSASRRQLMEEITSEKEIFYTFSQGIYETTLIASRSLDSMIDRIFSHERRLSQKFNLSSITLRLPQSNTEVSGVYYFILRSLAWAGINICEIISTSNEISIVVSNDDVDKAFSILMKMKR